MYIVTGAAGFVGSNIIRALNDLCVTDILAVDDLTQGDKFRNLADSWVADYMDHVEFRDYIRRGAPGLEKAGTILHQGACADTTEPNGRYMMDTNYTFSKELLHWALDRKVPFVYASSASVYGLTRECVELPDCEAPLNVYAYSKLQFDQYVRRLLPRVDSTVVGLRYFNVYGPRELHKGRMASMVWQIYRQLKDTGVVKLFQGTDGFGDGEQRRDFVSVADVAAVNLHFAAARPEVQAIVNVGTGSCYSFNEIAHALIRRLGTGRIEYVPFPDTLRGKYQSFTQADTKALQAAGYDRKFKTLEEGIDLMLAWAESSAATGEVAPAKATT